MLSVPCQYKIPILIKEIIRDLKRGSGESLLGKGSFSSIDIIKMIFPMVT